MTFGVDQTYSHRACGPDPLIDDYPNLPAALTITAEVRSIATPTTNTCPALLHVTTVPLSSLTSTPNSSSQDRGSAVGEAVQGQAMYFGHCHCLSQTKTPSADSECHAVRMHSYTQIAKCRHLGWMTFLEPIWSQSWMTENPIRGLLSIMISVYPL